ncbi:MAG: LamG domain-containing protein, partial [bacterium]|nr:LamG domain-containing protein [bacterium]
GARDSRRKADIEAIAKAYEVQKGTGYIALQDSHFASGKKPTDPSKGEYFNYLASDGSGYKVCAALDNNPSDACNTPALNCYCKTSVQATINPSSPYDPSSTQYLLGLGGSSDSSCDPNGTLLSGLVGYWKMDETTNWNSTPGEVRDSSGNGNNGTAYGGANITQHTPDPTGVFKNAGNFNGSSGYIELGNPSLFNSNFTELTVSAWFKSNIWSNEYPSPDYSMDVLVSKWDRQAGNIDVGFRFERTYGGCCFGIWVSSGTDMGANQAQVPIGSVSTGVWHHAVGTFKGGNFVRLYLDGGLINEQTSGIYPQVTAATLQNLRIGVMSHGYGFFNGLIDDVRIYNRALSGDSPDSEITHLYNGGDGCAP